MREHLGRHPTANRKEETSPDEFSTLKFHFKIKERMNKAKGKETIEADHRETVFTLK